jgi:hypothetical protein
VSNSDTEISLETTSFVNEIFKDLPNPVLVSNAKLLGTIREVFDSLASLKCASSSGPDSTPPILLYNCRWALT